MESKNITGSDFNSIQFEKRLSSLKDSQESINSCCHWCLENRQHHKKIVNAWLNVLKRAKIEQRLTLFYLANDVIQYSKRRNYDFVESWGTTLQKATTMVRDERVKHKILRIFKIWEQRGIYNEEFISDLSGLISASPRKGDEQHEFQSSYLINKIKTCSKLENDTDAKLRKLKEHTTKFNVDAESLFSSLKERAHVDDVEKEVDDYVKHMENYVNSLKTEIKTRIHLISLLTQTETQLETDWKDVKLVANAYKTFGARVKAVKKKMDELLPSLSSPIPSPDVNAPSPSPDSDIELPNTDNALETKLAGTNAPVGGYTNTPFTNAGYYNPVPPPSTDSTASFINNGFSSFIGSNMPFNMEDFNPATLFTNQTTVQNTTTSTTTTDSYNLNSNVQNLFPSINQQPPPPPEMVPQPANFQPPPSSNFQYGSTHMPLMPPPMPPFSKTDTSYGNTSTYTDGYNSNPSNNYASTSYETYPSQQNYQPQQPHYQQSSVTSYETPETYQPVMSAYEVNSDQPSTSYEVPDGSSTYGAASEEYNPEEEPDTWEPDASWMQPANLETDTPESPPIFEKEAYSEPTREYHDNVEHGNGVDVDHRVLPIIPPVNPSTDMGHRGKDIDHRNLISLTGSPGDTNSAPSIWSSKGDQDYRKPLKSNPGGSDQDYRVPFNLDQLKLPPPPPPPPKQFLSNLIQSKNMNQMKKTGLSPRKMQDNVESIDMELSDDDLKTDDEQPLKESTRDNLKVVVDASKDNQIAGSLEPPPPFPDLPEDVEANNFLDDLDNEISSGEFTVNLNVAENRSTNTLPRDAIMWNNMCPPPGIQDNSMCRPPNMNLPPPLMSGGGQINPHGWIDKGFNQEFGFRGRGNNNINKSNFNNRSHWGNNEYRNRGRGGNWSFRGGTNNYRGNRNGSGRGRNSRPSRGNSRGNFNNSAFL